jgi:hypothetical protein
MDLVDVPPRHRRGPGRPRLYKDRQYVNLTAEQRADLDALVQLQGGCLADWVREAVDRLRAAEHATIQAARRPNGVGEEVMSA